MATTIYGTIRYDRPFSEQGSAPRLESEEVMMAIKRQSRTVTRTTGLQNTSGGIDSSMFADSRSTGSCGIFSREEKTNNSLWPFSIDYVDPFWFFDHTPDLVDYGPCPEAGTFLDAEQTETQYTFSRDHYTFNPSRREGLRLQSFSMLSGSATQQTVKRYITTTLGSYTYADQYSHKHESSQSDYGAMIFNFTSPAGESCEFRVTNTQLSGHDRVKLNFCPSMTISQTVTGIRAYLGLEN